MNKWITPTAFWLMILASATSQAASVNLPACISEHYNNQPISSNDIEILAPDIAESGAVVSVGILRVNNKSSDRRVQQLTFYNEFIDKPVARFTFSEHTSAEKLKTRIRLRASSHLYAVARLDNGQLLGGQRHIKVTAGGCGIGDVPEYFHSKRVCPPR